MLRCGRCDGWVVWGLTRVVRNMLWVFYLVFSKRYTQGGARRGVIKSVLVCSGKLAAAGSEGPFPRDDTTLCQMRYTNGMVFELQ